MSNKFSKHKWWIVTALLTLPLIAIAAVPNTFMPNTTISSSAVNANFAALDARIAALETLATNKTSATTLNGSIGNLTTPVTGPKNVTFTASGANPLLLIVSASCYSGAGGAVDLSIALDGVTIGDLQGWTNETGSHKALVTRTFTVTPPPAAGTHTIGINYGNTNTTSDANDFYSVTVIEMH